MAEAILFAIVASIALPLGGAVAIWRPPSRFVTAVLLAFASGALITAVAFDLFEDAFEGGGAWRAGIAFFAGSAAFILVDRWLEQRNAARVAAGAAMGWAILAAVTLDGVPENVAMGVSLVDGTGTALLVAIFASNFPEAVVGALRMREAGISPERVVLIWSATAVLLAVAVVCGFAASEGLSRESLAWPLGFAGGAVLASLADTLMPEAYKEGGPLVAFATALGFLASFLVSAA